MSKSLIMPLLMGVAMSVMALAMLHGMMTGQSVASAGAAVFILAHVAVALVLIAATIWGLKSRSPIVQRLAKHRPSWRHIGIMIATTLCIVTVVHLLHGAP